MVNCRNWIRSWLNSGRQENKNKQKYSSVNSRKANNKKQSTEKRASKNVTENSKVRKPKDHYSEDEGFVCETKDSSPSDIDSRLRRSRRNSLKSGPRYTENSDDDFEEMPPATWGSAKSRSQVSNTSEGKLDKAPDSDIESIEDDDKELEIAEFMEEKEVAEQKEDESQKRSVQGFEKPDSFMPYSRTPVKGSLATKPKPETPTSETVSNPFASIVSNVKGKENTSLAEMMEETHISDVDTSESSSSGEDFETAQSSYYQTPEKRRRFRNPSSDSGVNSTPPEKETFKSKRKIHYPTSETQSRDQEESELSVDEEDLAVQLMQGKEDVEFRRKSKDLVSEVDIIRKGISEDVEENREEEYGCGSDEDYGAFNDVMQSFFLNVSQRSQSSQEYGSSQETVEGKRLV